MMPITAEPQCSVAQPAGTREQAQQLLEELRAAYRECPGHMRDAVRAAIRDHEAEIEEL